MLTQRACLGIISVELMITLKIGSSRIRVVECLMDFGVCQIPVIDLIVLTRTSIDKSDIVDD